MTTKNHTDQSRDAEKVGVGNPHYDPKKGPTQSEIDSINARLQHDLAKLVNVTSGNAFENIKPALDAVEADLKAGRLGGAKHLLQAIIQAIPDVPDDAP